MFGIRLTVRITIIHAMWALAALTPMLLLIDGLGLGSGWRVAAAAVAAFVAARLTPEGAP
jgi:hypothetical protein